MNFEREFLDSLLENQITGTQTMLGNGDKPSDRDVTDGTSNTILAVEAQRDVPLTKPEDIPFDPKLPLPQIGGFTPDGANVLFGDGSVRYIRAPKITWRSAHWQ